MRLTAKSYCIRFLVTLAVLGMSTECYLRFSRRSPSVIDNRALWALHRDQVYQGGKQTVALLGASRIQLGISPARIRTHLPDYQIVQLAVDSRRPMAVLSDLAQDDRFVGTVICSVTPDAFEPQRFAEQQPYVDYYHREYSIAVGWVRRISGFVQQHLTFTNPKAPKYLTTKFDRSREADYQQVDLALHRKLRLDSKQTMIRTFEASTPSEWCAHARRVAISVKRIQRRGGRVVFVYLPTDDSLYELDSQIYPKSQYWDQLAEQTSATTLHFKDIPTMSDFECPDLSHLDYRDVPRLTDALINELETRMVFHSRSGDRTIATR